MKQQDVEHINLLNTLLARTNEFIEFFNHAEAKMIKWRHEITQQATLQQQQLNLLQTELEQMQTFISESGLNCFRSAAEETASQSDEYLQSLKSTEQQLLRQIHGHRAEITRITQHALSQITQQTTHAVTQLNEKLSLSTAAQITCNPHTFEVTTKSEELSQTGTPELVLPNRVHSWRAISLTMVTSILTALIFGLYTTDEYPWEMHQQAHNERGAGKMLLSAWPTLTHQEKRKILYRVP
jgi:hypothetical protein